MRQCCGLRGQLEQFHKDAQQLNQAHEIGEIISILGGAAPVLCSPVLKDQQELELQ